MPIDIQNLHIKSSVIQRAPGDGAAAGAAPASAAGAGTGTAAPKSAGRQAAGGCCDDEQLREQVLADCRRLIRAALMQQRER